LRRRRREGEATMADSILKRRGGEGVKKMKENIEEEER